MSRRADRSAAARKAALIAAMIALALGGCGGTSAAVSGAAHVSRAATGLSENVMRSSCRQAVAGGGRRVTVAQARGCLRRAWDAWLGELRRDG